MFYFHEIRDNDPFTNIKRREYVLYINFTHEISIKLASREYKRRKSVPCIGIAKLKHREQKTLIELESSAIQLESSLMELDKLDKRAH